VLLLFKIVASCSRHLSLTTSVALVTVAPRVVREQHDARARRGDVVEGVAHEADEEVGASVLAVEDVSVPKRRPFVGDRLLTVGEVAATMRVSNMTVYRLIKAGQLAAIRVGKNYRIRESDVNKYLSDRSVNVEGQG
jgi:excisionase family DNA binding protein